MVAAGWSLLLLAVFYAVIDVLGYRKWAFFFIVLGMNAITIYFMHYWVDFEQISKFFLAGPARLSGELGVVVIKTGIVVAEWLWLWFLYRKRVFLRV